MKEEIIKVQDYKLDNYETFSHFFLYKILINIDKNLQSLLLIIYNINNLYYKIIISGYIRSLIISNSNFKLLLFYSKKFDIIISGSIGKE